MQTEIVIDKKLIHDTLNAINGVIGLIYKKIEDLKRQRDNTKLKDRHKIDALETEIRRLLACAENVDQTRKIYETMHTDACLRNAVWCRAEIPCAVGSRNEPTK